MAWVLMFLSWYTISRMNVKPSAVGHREGDEVRWLPRRKKIQTCAREGTLDFSLQIKGSCLLRITILACALLTGLVTGCGQSVDVGVVQLYSLRGCVARRLLGMLENRVYKRDTKGH